MERTDTLPPDIELAQLLQRCAAADTAAFRMLYDKTSPILFARLLRMLRRRSVAEEVLQDVFVRIWQRASQFEAHRGHALAWMVTIARYCAIDLMRRERMTLVSDDAIAEIPTRPRRTRAASRSLTTSITASASSTTTRGSA
jgi:RNA polymerase sigma-70 factor (ECF subfamily)